MLLLKHVNIEKYLKDYNIINYNMYIRIEFDDIESDKTKNTQQLFFSIPNGMFLSSSKAYPISSVEIREVSRNTVVFWYVDLDILNKKYGGAVKCLHELLRYHGVSRVDILPVEGDFIGKRNELLTILMKYIKGVNV
jgi:hypothetical protein